MVQINQSNASTIEQLNAQLREMERSRPPARQVVRTNCPQLDQMLPRQGILRGSIVEWLTDGPGCGAFALAFVAARQALRDGRSLVIIDRRKRLYPPALSAWGIDLNRVVMIHPKSEKDELWALEQSLRCPAVSAVLASPQKLDSYTYRRLQLAAETSQGLGLFVRSAELLHLPSWAELRWLVAARSVDSGWGLHVQLLRCRGYLGEGSIDVVIDEQTGEIDAADSSGPSAELAHSTLASSSA